MAGITLQWNGKTVFNGNGSTSLCYDIARAFVRDNFAGSGVDRCLSNFTLDRVLTNEKDGLTTTLCHEDETGRALVFINFR